MFDVGEIGCQRDRQALTLDAHDELHYGFITVRVVTCHDVEVVAATARGLMRAPLRVDDRQRGRR